MRFSRLFADLEAQLAVAEAEELAAEVADRTRREAGLVRAVDRLRAAVGAQLAVSVSGQQVLRGRLLDAGQDWLLLADSRGAELLVPLAAVLGVVGLPAPVAPPAGEVERRLDLRWSLRGLARSRVGVAVGLTDGSSLTGTLDRVGADHVELAEHAPGEVRRPGSVRQVRLVPLSAVALVRSG